MRKSGAIFAACLLFGGILVWWWFGRNTESPRRSSKPPVVGVQKLAPVNPLREKSAKPLNHGEDSSSDDKEESFLVKNESVRKEFAIPITFYGQVIDEKGNPVPDATATFSVSDLSKTANTKYQRTSGNDGLFSLDGIKGGGMTVRVGKDGYYSKIGGTGFVYNTYGTTHIPDPNNPVVFRLWKKGEAAELVKVEKNFKIPRDGTPFGVSLLTGKKVSPDQADLKVECWTFDKEKDDKGHYDWKCQISVLGGGLVETSQEFPFEAPAEGYRPTDEIDMPRSKSDLWKSDVEKQYFLKLKDGNYARITFAMIAGGDHFFMLKSYLNPDKSRNLEYDKSKEIEVREK